MKKFLSMFCFGLVGAALIVSPAMAKKKAKPVKEEAKEATTETKVEEQKAPTQETFADSLYSGTTWEYHSERMKPPKNTKWTKRWNDLGAQGWMLVGQVDKYYIFKRPAASNSGSAKSGSKDF